jgi:hypothetical protein
MASWDVSARGNTAAHRRANRTAAGVERQLIATGSIEGTDRVGDGPSWGALDRTFKVLHADGEPGEKTARFPGCRSCGVQCAAALRPVSSGFRNSGEARSGEGPPHAAQLRHTCGTDDLEGRCKVSGKEELYAAALDAVPLVLIGLEKHSAGISYRLKW